MNHARPSSSNMSSHPVGVQLDTFGSFHGLPPDFKNILRGRSNLWDVGLAGVPERIRLLVLSFTQPLAREV
jgi:hypothetical protein